MIANHNHYKTQNCRKRNPEGEGAASLGRTLANALDREGRQHLQTDHTNLQNVLRQENSHHCFQLRKPSLGVNKHSKGHDWTSQIQTQIYLILKPTH